jgi:hypothetical protein
MPMSSGNEKICVICGEDCSNKPRTKDSKGRYYCKPCHDQALREKRGIAKTAKAAAVFKPPPPPKKRDDDPLSLLDELIPDVAPVAAAGGVRACANCGGAMTPGAVICLNCGFNTQTGHKLDVSVSKPKRDDGGATDFLGTNGPLFAGLGAVVIYAALAFVTNGISDPQSAVATYYAFHMPFATAAWIFVLVLAFKESVGTGFLTLCVPCYILYFVYGVTDSRWAKFLYSASLVGNVIWIVMFYDTFQSNRF